MGLALLPALREVLSAADGTRAACVGIDGLVAFVLGLTTDAHDDSDTSVRGVSGAVGATAGSAHLELCLALCCEALVLADDGAADTRVEARDAIKLLCKGLSLAVLPPPLAQTAEGRARLATLGG